MKKGTPVCLLLLAACLAAPTLAAQQDAASSTPAVAPVEFKLNKADSVSLGPRLGNVWWQCQTVPPGTSVLNGIRGSFVFNGPTIPSIGIGSRIGIGPGLRFSPSLDFVFDEYVYRADLGRAFMTQNMTGSAVGPVATVMGIMVSLPLYFDIKLSERVSLGLAPGLVVYPRIALIAIDNSTGIEQISAALNANLGWLYPETAVSVSYALNPTTNIGFQLAVLYPLSHLFSNDGMGADGMMLTGYFGLDFYF